MRMQFDNQSTNALGRVFQNLATLPARARLMEQENEIKAMMNRSLMDSRASQIELNRAKAARENQALGLMARAAKLFPTDRDAANFYALQGGGKAYTPFSNVGNTGFSINEATGVQTLGNPDLARIFQVKTVSGGSGGNGGSGSVGRVLNPSQIRESFVRLTNGEDPYGNPTVNKVFDETGYQDYITQAAQHPGYVHTPGNVAKYLGGVMPWGPAPEQVVPQPTIPMAQSPAIEQTYVPPEQTNRNAAIESIRSRRQSGELSREDAVIALKALGFQ